MAVRKSILILLPLLWLVASLRFGFTLDSFPSRPATHFNASGNADGWMSKDAFVSSWIVTLVFLNLLIIGVCWSVRFLPDFMFNLPHRAYWLSPKRRSQTFGQILGLGLWLAFSVTLLFVSLYESVLKANQHQPPRLPDHYWIPMVPPFLIMLLATWRFAAKFRKPPATGEAESLAAQ